VLTSQPEAKNPSCPESVLQFQHGTYTETDTGGLKLTPIAVDGRELISAPCDGDTSALKRYNQPETIKSYQVSKDAYTGAARLDLYQFNGSPMIPMFLAYTPPQMLPTVTMNPTAAASGAAATTAANGKRSESDSLYGRDLPLNKDSQHIKRSDGWSGEDSAWIWWTGLGMTLVGGVAYLL
jgi:hypothetical protein